MASRRAQRRNEEAQARKQEERDKARCERKLPYETQDEAIRAARVLRVKQGGLLLRWYQCNICQKWHLGREDGWRITQRASNA